MSEQDMKSVVIYVLCFVVDKGQCFSLEFCLYQSCARIKRLRDEGGINSLFLRCFFSDFLLNCFLSRNCWNGDVTPTQLPDKVSIVVYTLLSFK